jgi:phosphate starvation-inducible PhoH-like protein
LDKGRINKIVYVPNNSIVENSRELGILPGETIDKELAYMGPILDIVGEIRAREMVMKGQIEVVPLAVMRGRSFANSIVLVNEAQNLTTEHVKLLIARCGEGTRIFFDGDIKQSDSHVFKNKNGLKLLLHLSESPEYAPIFGTVKLNSIERSKTAQASAYLEQLLI